MQRERAAGSLSQFTNLIATALRFSTRATNRYKGLRLASIPDHKAVADAIIAV